MNVDGVVMGAPDRTTWQLIYNAPAQGTGRISFHIAAVDGDAGATSDAPADPFGDDVYIEKHRHCEQFKSCDTSFADSDPLEREATAGHGCTLSQNGRTPSLPSAPLWLLGLGYLFRRHNKM